MDLCIEGWVPISLVRREAVLDDAGGVVERAADEAEAVGHQRQAHHRVCVVSEGAQDGAVVDVEELRYYASRDPAPGCDRDLGKRHHNDDRPVRRAEIEPLVTRAICGRSNATAACRGAIF